MKTLLASAMRSIALIAAVLTTSHALGQGINLDIEWPLGAAGGPGAGIPPNTFPGAANQPGAWNRVFQTVNPVPLNGLDGLASGVSMLRSTTATHGGIDSANTSGDHALVLDDFQSVAGTLTISFTGLDAGWYEVYTYAINPGSTAKTNVTISGSDPPSTQQAGGVMPVNAFVLGRTHTRHRVLVGAAGTLSLTLAGASGGAGAFSAMQLKPVDPCPVVDITNPANFECICESENVRGNVTAPAPGTLAYWYLEYRALSDMNWSFINFGFNTGVNIFLGTFDTTGLSQGYYFIRLTGVGGDGCQHEDTHIVWVDKQFDALDMVYPVSGQAYGQAVCVGGIVDDHCLRYYTIQWAPLPAGAPYTDINPGMPFYSGHFPIVGTWASWDTIAQSIPDGDYRIKVEAVDNCGHSATESVDFLVDNTPPVADITSPQNCEFIQCGSIVSVKGTACDTNLVAWTLQVTGGPYLSWTTIASGNTCIVDDLIANWDTTGLPNCGYTLRLLVSDSSILNCNGAISHLSEDVVTVNIGLKGDVNGDGEVNFADITEVLQYWGFTCP